MFSSKPVSTRSKSDDVEPKVHRKARCDRPTLSVLVVDDDSNLRQALGRHLKAAGFHFLSAADGMEAMTILDEQDVNVVILDVKMPGMDGFEICQTIKRTRDLPVIILTGAQNPMLNEYLPKMADGAGADRYLRKPCDCRELIDLIHDVLQDY